MIPGWLIYGREGVRSARAWNGHKKVERVILFSSLFESKKLGEKVT